MKKIFRIFFSLLLIFSVFGVVNVLAAEGVFKITNISVKEKSNGVTVNDVSLSEGVIVNNIIFTNEDDYIKYDITIKNNTSNKYKILSISDNNESNYLDYTYDDLSNVELDSNEEKTFNLTITYIQESDDLTILNQNVSLTLNYENEDGTTGSEVIGGNDNSNNTNISDSVTNPKTGDNIYLYIILGLISVGGLVITTVSSKKFAKGMMVIALASSLIIPFGVNADTDVFEIIFNNDIRDADVNITYNANGGKFSNNATKMVIPYKGSEIVKISHTENIDETGKKISNYGTDWYDDNIVGSDRGNSSLPHIITIPGATSLTVDIYYGGDTGEYSVCAVHEALTDYNDFSWNDGTYHDYYIEQDGTYEINGNTVTNIGHDQFTIDGDTVTFGFWSSGNEVVNGYGYYAVVRGFGAAAVTTYEEPTYEDFEFNGWYTDPECSNGNQFDFSNVTGDTEVYAKWKDVNVFELGDERCFGIGEDCFYVIGYQDDTHVKLLSKYPIELSSDRQQDTSSGFTNFSNSEYWASDGNNYPRDVYNENSLMYPHIEAYVDFLKTYNVNVTGRLLSVEDFDDLGITLTDDLYVHNALESAPSWLRGDYWTGVAGSSYGLYRFNGYGLYINGIDGGSVYGTSKVRPVIVLEVDN